MKLTTLIEDVSPKLREISINCQQFIEESNGKPLVKWFSVDYPDVHRVKMRKRKQGTAFDSAFNEAFYEQYPSLRQRSIIVNETPATGKEPFFVFPSDGFKFMYSPTITNSTNQYGSTFTDIRKSLSEETGKEIFQDILTYAYMSDSLETAIVESSEIIVYNIPYFYVVRCNTDYTKLLENIT